MRASRSSIVPASADAAVAAAAHDVLVALFPSQSADLDTKYEAALNGLPDDQARANGIEVGQQAAAAILLARANDGRDATVTYIPGSGPGVYVPTPPAFLAALSPETPLVQPFALQSASQFRPGPPPDLGSRLWARDYNEIKALGGMVSSRTAEQTDIGRFWSDNTPLQWIRAWRALSVGNFLRLNENARYFAMLSTASADALIACWEAKYHYNFWRPVTAIRAGDTDGNPRTEPDAEWIGQVVDAESPGIPRRAWLRQLGDHGDLEGLLPDRRDLLFHRQQRRGPSQPRPKLLEVLRCVGRSHRRQGLRGHALSKFLEGRRGGRQAGVALRDETSLSRVRQILRRLAPFQNDDA